MEDNKLTLAVSLITKHPQYIPVIKSKYLTDDIYIMCLEDEPSLFRYIPHPSPNVVRVALQLDGSNIKYIKKKIRKQMSPELFVMAVSSNPREALPYVPKKYIPEEIKQHIFDTDPELLQENNLKIASESFLRDRIEASPGVIKYITDPSDDLKCLALRKDPNTALYFDTLTPSMMNVIDELYPGLRETLPNYNRDYQE